MRELGQRLGADELTEWLAYATIEPWGEDREDYRFSVLAALIANQWRGSKDRTINPEEFLPDYSGEREQRRRKARQRGLLAWVEQVKRQSACGNGDDDDRQPDS